MLIKSLCLVLSGIYFQNILFAQNINNSFFNNTPAIEMSMNGKTSLTNNNLTWNPHNYTYYIAGSDTIASYIASYDAMGDFITVDTFDARLKGIWYNTTLDFLEAYNVNDNTCVSFLLNDEGEFVGQDFDIELADLEEEGTSVFPIYNSEREVYVYFEPVAKIIIEVEPFSGEISHYISFPLSVGKNEIVEDQILFTDMKASPYAIVNRKNKSLFLINYEGQIVQEVSWPMINFEPIRFAWTNGALWLLNEQTLTWKAYAIR
ncbi:MAG: hypothetical protein M9958_10310 [Chitinophagales bacterium]|nr:hypothetical protein [Chitinophagales bacterium]